MSVRTCRPCVRARADHECACVGLAQGGNNDEGAGCRGGFPFAEGAARGVARTRAVPAVATPTPPAAARGQAAKGQGCTCGPAAQETIEME
eukprot:2456790-Pleurochrysis_carterae.AAC.1